MCCNWWIALIFCRRLRSYAVGAPVGYRGDQLVALGVAAAPFPLEVWLARIFSLVSPPPGLQSRVRLRPVLLYGEVTLVSYDGLQI